MPEDAAKISEGSLNIQTDPPGARVTVDGVVAGVTPLQMHHVKAGDHSVAVELASGLVQRTVRVDQGVITQLELVAASMAPAPVAETPAQGTNAAAQEFRASLLELPWAGAAVMVTVAFVLAAIVLWSSTPAELPFSKNLPMAIPPIAWQTGQVMALFGAVASGAVSVVLLLLVSTPLARLVSLAQAAVETKGK